MISMTAKLFLGHLIAGALFFILGTWWAVGAWHAYCICRHRKNYYGRRAYFVHPGIKPRCIEGFYKVAFGMFGVVAFGWIVIVKGLFEDGRDAQHVSVSLFMCINGALDLLTHYGAPLPQGTDYVGLLMSLSVEALVFYLHLHGRQSSDVLVHTLLVITVVSEAACVAVEMVRRHCVLATLGRAFFGILQGTWFFQMAFILYNQLAGALPWDDTEQSLMVASAVFTWHGFGVLLYLGLVGVFVSMCSKKCRDSGSTEDVHSALLPGFSDTASSCALDSLKIHTEFETDENRGA